MSPTAKTERRPALLALTAWILLIGPTAQAATPQSAAQAKCITSMNKAGAKLSATQGKADVTCVKNAGAGTESDATACLTRDDGGKVASAADKLTGTAAKSCTSTPDFGPNQGAPAAIAAAASSPRALVTDLFGDNPTATLKTAASDAAIASCQLAVVGTSQKLSDAIIKEFGACKAAGLKDGSIDSASRLAGCLDTVTADLGGKIAKAADKAKASLSSGCSGVSLATALPGFCLGYTNVTDCVVARARCRACGTLQMDNLGAFCDGFDDGVPSNGTCYETLLSTERVSLASPAEPAETPGSPGVVVTNPKLLTQFGPSGPDLNRSESVRWRLQGSDATPDAILILVPGFGSGVNPLRTLAENLIPKILADKGIQLEVWGFSRRDDLLEDRAGIAIAAAAKDPAIAMDWYYGDELGLTLSPELVAGPNRRAVFYNAQDDIPFLANFTPQVYAEDMDATVKAALAITPNVFLGGHSAGTGFVARYASTNFNTSGSGAADPGYSRLRGLILMEGGGGSTASSAPLSEDTLQRIVAKADGGLFGAVRDNAPRCVDGTTPCTIATEATDCVGQVPPKCTPAQTSYTSIGGLKPQIYAAGEVGAVQGLKDPEKGQVILQVDQGAPGNNAIAKVPGLAPLAPPIIPAATIEGLFGIFLDDDGANASVLSPALATSLGEQGPNVGGLATWKDIDGDGVMSAGARPNNGAQPTTLPTGLAGDRWGREVEVSRMDRHIQTFIAGGENASDWYYAGSGLSTLSVTGLCSSGTCAVGKAGSCTTNSDCSQSISLDSSALSATRPDIANLTQAPGINIPVIAFGGSNGLTPLGSNFLAFAKSIGACTASSCDGSTGRVVSETNPSPPFPTYGSVSGGFEVYISEGYAHVDVLTAEDTVENQIPERLEDFLERNLVP